MCDSRLFQLWMAFVSGGDGDNPSPCSTHSKAFDPPIPPPTVTLLPHHQDRTGGCHVTKRSQFDTWGGDVSELGVACSRDHTFCRNSTPGALALCD